MFDDNSENNKSVAENNHFDDNFDNEDKFDKADNNEDIGEKILNTQEKASVKNFLDDILS